MTDSAPGVELLDVFDDLGRHVGVKSRHDVHADGDWHQVFHCQIVTSRGGIPTAVLQRRSDDKAAFPGHLDVSAAGHLAAGETPIDGRRELHEELGVLPPAGDLQSLGLRRLVDDSGEGTLNRELTHVYLLRDDRDLAEYVLATDEVDAVFDVPIEGLLALLGGHDANLDVSGVRAAGSGDATGIDTTLALGDLVPGSAYWITLMVMAERYLAGRGPLAI